MMMDDKNMNRTLLQLLRNLRTVCSAFSVLNSTTMPSSTEINQILESSDLHQSLSNSPLLPTSSSLSGEDQKVVLSSTTITPLPLDDLVYRDDEFPSSSPSGDAFFATHLLCRNLHDIEKSYNSSGILDDKMKEVLSDIYSLDYEKPPFKYTLVVILYSILIVVSLIGNLFVIWAIFSKKRTRTTVNILIGNLAWSDLMMTILNIPFTVARFVMREWVFGEALCHVVPFIQALSVYVSTLTMAFIAVDRFQAILRPMKSRISSKVGSLLAILLIWCVATAFSLPFLFFNRIVLDTKFRPLKRCRVVYPEPEYWYQRVIGVMTLVCQFVIPFTIMVCLYTKIAIKIWYRVSIGATTREQEIRALKAKKRTIIMLLAVAIVFAVCWMPLNVYHTLVDFNVIHHDFNKLISVHYIAVSSVCYNPFIYFWLNRRFQQILNNCCLSFWNSCACCRFSCLPCLDDKGPPSPISVNSSPANRSGLNRRACVTRRHYFGHHHHHHRNHHQINRRSLELPDDITLTGGNGSSNSSRRTAAITANKLAGLNDSTTRFLHNSSPFGSSSSFPCGHIPADIPLTNTSSLMTATTTITPKLVVDSGGGGNCPACFRQSPPVVDFDPCRQNRAMSDATDNACLGNNNLEGTSQARDGRYSGTRGARKLLKIRNHHHSNREKKLCISREFCSGGSQHSSESGGGSSSGGRSHHENHLQCHYSRRIGRGKNVKDSVLSSL